ncbi:hypothetical protein Leryth_013569 [Lithospermum erythrorhizon]|nr:hypothetical protein Leryth_013569 [Lithospermum erythrorhizon]
MGNYNIPNSGTDKISSDAVYIIGCTKVQGGRENTEARERTAFSKVEILRRDVVQGLKTTIIYLNCRRTNDRPD